MVHSFFDARVFGLEACGEVRIVLQVVEFLKEEERLEGVRKGGEKRG